MKKLLLTLTLLLTLGFAASAQDPSDELTSSNFTGMAYGTGKSYTASSGAVYFAQASSNKGFQLRTSKKGTGIKNTQAPSGYIIKSVEITFSTVGGGANVYASDAAIDLSTLPTAATAQTSKTTTVDINAPYFAITATSDNLCIITKVVVNWQSAGPAACDIPTFSIKDGAEVFAGQTITVNKGNADACELLVNGEPVEGLEYTIPETAEVGSTITLTANSTLEEGDPAEASASITVSIVELKPYYLLTDIVDLYDGAKGYIVCTNSNVIMGAQNSGNYREKVILSAEAISEGILAEVPDGAEMVTFVQDGENYYLKVSDGYLCLTSDGNSLYTNSNADNTAKASIVVDNSNSSISFASYSTRAICYNASASRFACYKASSNQAAVQIYIEPKAEPETELVAITHEFVPGRTQARVDYMLHLNNHKDANEYVVELTIPGIAEVFTNATHTDVSIVEETANAPMRVLNPNDVMSETTLKGQVMATGLEGEHPYGAATLVAKLGDKVLGTTSIENFTTGTTGIEDVTVENEAAAEYFNLQGVRVAEPQAGQIYIVRRGAKATKELVK